MKILFIVNGKCDNIRKNLPKDFFNCFDKIVCVDGGLNNLYKINKNIVPDFIIGDFDSIKSSLLDKYKNKSKIVEKNNQDESDLYFSVKYITEMYKNIEEIIVLCGTGTRFDHTLCNIILLSKIHIKNKIIGDSEEVYLLKNELEIKDRKGWTLSLIPLTKMKNVFSKGLKWQYKNTNLDFGFINGISNIVESSNLKITADDGVAVVVMTNPKNID